jgi:cytochrome P450
MSLWDTLRFYVLVLIPILLSGFVAPNRPFVYLFARWDFRGCAARLVAALQLKYECKHLWLWFPFARTLLVLDPESIGAVLASSATAVDPLPKKLALSRFVPDALVISNDDKTWPDRRSFNERVLTFGHPPALGETFKDIALNAVDSWAAGPNRHLRWADFQSLSLQISHQVLLGVGQVRPEMARQVARLAIASNFLLRWPFDFSAFYKQIERSLQSDASRSIPCLVQHAAQLLASGSATTPTQVPRQIGFWFFVLKEALELHVARTLALIAAHGEIQDRLRRAINQVPVLTAGAITDLQLLDACIREQLRLWTPVPLLLRRAVGDFPLRGAIPIQAKQQLLMLAGLYHRDARVFGADADRFTPDALSGSFPIPYYFSAGGRSCAGQFVVMFMLKATLAALLARFRFELAGPQLHPGRIPYSYNHFKIELRALDEGALAS